MTLGLKVPMQNNRIPNGLGLGQEEKNSTLKEVVLQINIAINNVGLVQTQIKAEVGELY